ncbi:Metallophosphoesterase [Sandaracinus amylolyticus]|nr:Metallophosphoesterase [Sandaracinus amylolyticus]
MRVRLAVIGDVHLRFDASDVAALDARGYDALLFVGDLAGYAQRGGVKVAKVIATLRTPAIVVPGNHDATNAAQLLAEVMHNDAAAALVSRGMSARVAELRAALGGAALGGYSLHAVRGADGERIDVVVARPHSFGGPRLSFRAYLREAFGVESIEQSTERLCAVIDRVEGERLIVLAHNGPSGLGDRRDAIWGVDFRPSEGDHGDVDLRAAIEHARARGKKVIAVVAGHMHRKLRGGGERAWQVREGETLFVNAARVPRVWREGGARKRCWVEVGIEGERVEAREVVSD